eukprot:90601_1
MEEMKDTKECQTQVRQVQESCDDRKLSSAAWNSGPGYVNDVNAKASSSGIHSAAYGRASTSQLENVVRFFTSPPFTMYQAPTMVPPPQAPGMVPPPQAPDMMALTPFMVHQDFRMVRPRQFPGMLRPAPFALPQDPDIMPPPLFALRSSQFVMRSASATLHTVPTTRPSVAFETPAVKACGHVLNPNANVFKPSMPPVP